MSIKINSRDMEILYDLFFFKTMTIAQIKRSHFYVDCKKYYRRRVRALENHGYIHSCECRHKRKRGFFLIYSLTKKGFEIVMGAKGVVPKQCQLMSQSVKHDLVLVDLAHKVKSSLNVSNYFSENSIQAFFEPDTSTFVGCAHINKSDACFELLVGTKKLQVIFEYERTPKVYPDYQKKLEGYYTSNKFDAILYITDHTSIQNLLATAETYVSQYYIPKVYWIDRNVFMNSKEEVTFVNVKGEKLCLKFNQPAGSRYGVCVP